jgi:hypothetical protein
MTVDSKSSLVSCNYAADQACNYTNTDNSNTTMPCDCAMNEDGSSWCPAAPVDSK